MEKGLLRALKIVKGSRSVSGSLGFQFHKANIKIYSGLSTMKYQNSAEIKEDN